MNLCLITSSFPIRDDDIAAPFVPPFARALEELGHTVYIVTPTKYGAPVGWNETERVYWFVWRAGRERLVDLKPSSPRDALRMWSLMSSGERALIEIVQAKKIDACLGLWAAPGGYLAWQAKKRYGVPFGVWALGSDINSWANYPIIGGIIRATLEHADAVFADGFALARKAGALAGKKCTFLSSMRPLPLERAVPVKLGAQPVHFLFVGRWERVKGADVLVKAAQIVGHKLGHAAAEIIFVGGGTLEPMLREFVAANGLNDMVCFVNQPPFPELLGYFKQANCVVIPSRNESIPLVLGEALQAGAPLIVSDVGDMGDLAREYQLGRVVPPDDAPALADALCDFVANGSTDSAQRGDLLQLLDLKTSARVCAETLGRFLKV